jgi:RNA polymerase sigma-70 factor (ECF subfamily)
MDETGWLAQTFEGQRAHLRSVAFRMLGSLSEADDAVQETWLRLERTDAGGVENLRAWLTTVVGRVCLDVLRARRSWPEELASARRPSADRDVAIDPEEEALLSESVGLALMVVLDTLAPAERLAFVLHDMFDLPFDEIAGVVGRSPAATRQLASRARRRIQGAPKVPEADLSRQREVVGAFLSAARRGDFEALVTVLHPEVVARVDASLPGRDRDRELHGAAIVAKTAARGGAGGGALALIDGVVGAVVAPLGRLLMVLRFTIVGGKIVEIEGITDPARLHRLEIAALPGHG